MPLYALILFLLAAPGLLAAGSATVSLATSAAYVREHSPDLAAARLRIAEAQGRLLGAGRLPNPELGFEFNTDRHGREYSVGLAFDQRFPVTARLRLEKALSRQQVHAAELEVREQERLLIAEAQALIVRLLSVGEQRALRERQVRLAGELASFTTTQAGKGEISPLDAAQAQVDSQRLQVETRRLEAEQVALLGELKPKLGVPAGSRLTVTGALPAPVMPAPASWSGRPDLQLARAKETAARTDTDLARAGRWGDIGAGLTWSRDREEAPGGLENTAFAGFRVSLPLPLWNRNEGPIAEKKAAAGRAALETKALAAGIASQVAAARDEMAALAALATETRERLLPLVKEQTDNLEKAYTAGQADLLALLRAREQKLQLEAAALEATRDFHLARIRYEAATATHTQSPRLP